jgi:uncharacterized membrane protein
MADWLSDTDARRFHACAIVVLIGSGVLLALFLIERGIAGLGALAVAAPAVWFSKLFIFGGVAEVAFNPWELGLIAWVMDLLACVALLASFGGIERLPVVGDALRQGHDRAAQALREYPGIRRMAVTGVTIFVFLPLPGSGSVVGTLLARLLGLTRMATFVCVSVGALVSVAVYAAIAVFLGSQWRAMLESPKLLVACTVLLIAFTWFAWLRVKRELRRR